MGVYSRGNAGNYPWSLALQTLSPKARTLRTSSTLSKGKDTSHACGAAEMGKSSRLHMQRFGGVGGGGGRVDVGFVTSDL